MKWKYKYILYLELTGVSELLCKSEAVSYSPLKLLWPKTLKILLQWGRNSTPSIAIWQLEWQTYFLASCLPSSSMTHFSLHSPKASTASAPLWRGSSINHLFISTLFLLISFKTISSSVISMLLTLRLTYLLQICLLICQVKMLYYFSGIFSCLWKKFRRQWEKVQFHCICSCL